MHRLVLAGISGLLILTGSVVAEARAFRLGGSLGVVRSYTRSNGTVVAAHYRTAPDGRLDNNLSYRGKSTLRSVIPQTVIKSLPTVGAPIQTASADAALTVAPAPIEAVAMPAVPEVHRHHVACSNEKSVGGTDPYNTFCMIN